MNTEMIIERIDTLCMEKNVSRSKMLQDCELGKSVIDNLKKGFDPKVESIIAMSDYFGVPANYLLGTGIFKKWSDIAENKGLILEAMSNNLSLPISIINSMKKDQYVFLRVVDSFLMDINITDEFIEVDVLVAKDDVEPAKIKIYPPTLEEAEEAYVRALIENGYIKKYKKLSKEEMERLRRAARIMLED